MKCIARGLSLTFLLLLFGGTGCSVHKEDEFIVGRWECFDKIEEKLYHTVLSFQEGYKFSATWCRVLPGANELAPELTFYGRWRRDGDRIVLYRIAYSSKRFDADPLALLIQTSPGTPRVLVDSTVASRRFTRQNDSPNKAADRMPGSNAPGESGRH